MEFRIAVLGHRHWDAATTEALLTEIAHATQVDRGTLEARLAEPSPWLVDIASADDAETLRQRWEARYEGVHLTVYPLREPVEAAPTAEAVDAVPAPDAVPVPAAVPTPSAAPASLAPPRPPVPRTPVMRPGRVLDMRIEAPPKQTSWLFAVFLIVGGLAAVQSWRDWYKERPAGELQGTAGPACADGPGHYTLEVDGVPRRYERGDETGRCVEDPERNPLGCTPPALLNGVRTLALGLSAGLDLVFALPTGIEATIEPGTYDVAGTSDDAPLATSNKPMCGAWTGTITIDALTWHDRPRATTHARWDPQQVSVQWDLRCQHGQPAKFRGCFVYPAGPR